MSEKKGLMATKIVGAITVILGIIVAIAPHYIAPVCAYHGKVIKATVMGKEMTILMKCSWTANAEVALGALIVVVGILLIASRQAETRMMLNVNALVLGIFVMLLPTYLIGVCVTETMPCRIATLPALLALGVVVIIVAIVGIVVARRTPKA